MISSTSDSEKDLERLNVDLMVVFEDPPPLLLLSDSNADTMILLLLRTLVVIIPLPLLLRATGERFLVFLPVVAVEEVVTVVIGEVEPADFDLDSVVDLDLVEPADDADLDNVNLGLVDDAVVVVEVLVLPCLDLEEEDLFDDEVVVVGSNADPSASRNDLQRRCDNDDEANEEEEEAGGCNEEEEKDETTLVVVSFFLLCTCCFGGEEAYGIAIHRFLLDKRWPCGGNGASLKLLVVVRSRVSQPSLFVVVAVLLVGTSTILPLSGCMYPLSYDLDGNLGDSFRGEKLPPPTTEEDRCCCSCCCCCW